MANRYYWNSAQMYNVSPLEQTMEMHSVPRPRRLHDWLMPRQPAEELLLGAVDGPALAGSPPRGVQIPALRKARIKYEGRCSGDDESGGRNHGGGSRKEERVSSLVW